MDEESLRVWRFDEKLYPFRGVMRLVRALEAAWSAFCAFNFRLRLPFLSAHLLSTLNSSS